MVLHITCTDWGEGLTAEQEKGGKFVCSSKLKNEKEKKATLSWLHTVIDYVLVAIAHY